MKIFQARAVLIRKHKTVTFIDALFEGSMLQMMLPVGIIPNGFEINVGDIFEAHCTQELNKSGRLVWVAGTVRIVSRCKVNVSYEMKNCRDIMKLNRGMAILGRDNLKLWKFRSEFLDEVSELMGQLGITRAYSSALMEYRGTSTAEPFSCKGRFSERNYLKITHEIELKKTCILTMRSVFDLSFVYRDTYCSTKHVPEIMLLEGIILGNNVNGLVEIVRKIVELSIQLAKDMDIPYDTRFENIAIEDCAQMFNPSQENFQERFDHYADSICAPTIIINAPINSPFVRTDNDGVKREVKFFVNHTSFYHGYSDENSYEILLSAFEAQFKALIEKGIYAELPVDYLELLRLGSPETYSFGFGVDRFLTHFLMSDSIQRIAHPLGI